MSPVRAEGRELGYILDIAETPELTGHVISPLYEDPDLAELSGQTLIGAELAVKYAIKDAEGRQPPSCRDLHGVHPHPHFPYVMR